MAEITSMQGKCGYKWEGDDEPGYSSIDIKTHSWTGVKMVWLNMHLWKCFQQESDLNCCCTLLSTIHIYLSALLLIGVKSKFDYVSTSYSTLRSEKTLKELFLQTIYETWLIAIKEWLCFWQVICQHLQLQYRRPFWICTQHPTYQQSVKKMP